MPMRQVAGLVVILALCSSTAWALPCASACKDEVASCATQECAGLHGPKFQRCKRAKCKKQIVLSCYHDLSVCGATSAKPPSAGGPPVLPGGW
jgi:hypothetical protein